MVVTSKEWVIVMELITGTELQIYVDAYVEEHKKSIPEVWCCLLLFLLLLLLLLVVVMFFSS